MSPALDVQRLGRADESALVPLVLDADGDRVRARRAACAVGNHVDRCHRRARPAGGAGAAAPRPPPRRGRGCGLRRGNGLRRQRLAVDPHFSRCCEPCPSDSVVGDVAGRDVERPREPHDAVEIRQAARLPVAGHLHVVPVARRAPRLPACASPAWSLPSRSDIGSARVRQRVAIGVVGGGEAFLMPRRRDVERAAQPLVAVVGATSGSRRRAPARSRRDAGMSASASTAARRVCRSGSWSSPACENRPAGFGRVRQHHRGGLAHAGGRMLQRAHRGAVRLRRSRCPARRAPAASRARGTRRR